jgi:uncharacterized membrane protein
MKLSAAVTVSLYAALMALIAPTLLPSPLLIGADSLALRTFASVSGSLAGILVAYVLNLSSDSRRKGSSKTNALAALTCVMFSLTIIVAARWYYPLQSYSSAELLMYFGALFLLCANLSALTYFIGKLSKWL